MKPNSGYFRPTQDRNYLFQFTYCFILTDYFKYLRITINLKNLCQPVDKIKKLKSLTSDISIVL